MQHEARSRACARACAFLNALLQRFMRLSENIPRRKLTYASAYLLTYIHTYLLACLLTYLLACLLTHLLACVESHCANATTILYTYSCLGLFACT